MADPEEGQPAETPEAETPEPVTPEPTEGTPEAAPEPEATPAPAEEPAPEPAKPSLDDFPLDDILAREDIKRWGQSISDRAASRAETKAEQLAQRRETDAAATEAAKRRQVQIDNEDFDQIGREEVAKSEANERYMDSLAKAGEAIGAATAARYSQELGEETVDRIISEHDAAGSSIMDLNRALAEESTKRAVGKATEVAIAEAEKRFDDKFEAMKTDGLVKERSAEAATTGPVEKVSGTPPVQEGSEEPQTWETMVDKFNAGDISWTEMEPYQKDHDKETGGSGMRN